MDVELALQGILLGILQGLTEFLPISSSAHLILVPFFLGWKPLGLTFDIILHVGTFLAVLIYFRKDWSALGTILYRRCSGQSQGNNSQLMDSLVLGTVPALVTGVFLKNVIKEHLRTPLVIAFTLALFALFLVWMDHRGEKKRSLHSLTRRDGILIGLAQVLAFIPGVSRAGITLTAGLALGFVRSDAARFSFLLSAPVVALAGVGGVYELLTRGSGCSVSISTLFIGVLFSFLSGILCIRFFLRFLDRYTLLVFVIYRLALAVVIFYSTP